jgi:hypothetical protein
VAIVMIAISNPVRTNSSAETRGAPNIGDTHGANFRAWRFPSLITAAGVFIENGDRARHCGRLPTLKRARLPAKAGRHRHARLSEAAKPMPVTVPSHSFAPWAFSADLAGSAILNAGYRETRQFSLPAIAGSAPTPPPLESVASGLSRSACA